MVASSLIKHIEGNNLGGKHEVEFPVAFEELPKHVKGNITVIATVELEDKKPSDFYLINIANVTNKGFTAYIYNIDKQNESSTTRIQINYIVERLIVN